MGVRGGCRKEPRNSGDLWIHEARAHLQEVELRGVRNAVGSLAGPDPLIGPFSHFKETDVKVQFLLI